MANSYSNSTRIQVCMANVKGATTMESLKLPVHVRKYHIAMTIASLKMSITT
jgi:hypothetical protein